MSFDNKLSSLVAKHKELGEKLSSGSLGGKEFASVSKEYSALSPIVEKIEEFRKAQESFAELETLSNDASDKEMQAITIDHPDYGATWRQADYNYFTSENCKKILKDKNIKVITWRELRDKLYR